MIDAEPARNTLAVVSVQRSFTSCCQCRKPKMNMCIAGFLLTPVL